MNKRQIRELQVRAYRRGYDFGYVVGMQRALMFIIFLLVGVGALFLGKYILGGA